MLDKDTNGGTCARGREVARTQGGSVPRTLSVRPGTLSFLLAMLSPC